MRKYLFFDDKNPKVLKERGFCYFDRLLAFCRKYEIFLLPDLHAVPGGQNPDWHSDNQTGIPQFWHFEAFQDQIVELWKEIAGYYAEETWILGYDILNEPFLIPGEDGRLQKFYDRVTAAVREADKNHIIFLEGDYFAMDFSAMKELKDEQTAITFHFYPTVWEADLCDPDYPREKRRSVFEDRLVTMIAGMQKFGRSLLCGEAGYDIAGHGLAHVMEMVEEKIKYHLQFRQRALLYTLQKEQLLKPQLMSYGWEQISGMPESFAMENCVFYEEYRELLRKYMRG